MDIIQHFKEALLKSLRLTWHWLHFRKGPSQVQHGAAQHAASDSGNVNQHSSVWLDAAKSANGKTP